MTDHPLQPLSGHLGMRPGRVQVGLRGVISEFLRAYQQSLPSAPSRKPGEGLPQQSNRSFPMLQDAQFLTMSVFLFFSRFGQLPAGHDLESSVRRPRLLRWRACVI